jgi:hypothetical protein
VKAMAKLSQKVVLQNHCKTTRVVALPPTGRTQAFMMPRNRLPSHCLKDGLTNLL